MRTLTIILDANDEAKSISTLAGGADAIDGWDDPLDINVKATAVTWFRIYAESTNDVDSSNGPARIGFETTDVEDDFLTSRVAAVQHGLKLLPGFSENFGFDGGPASGQYDFTKIAIAGKANDQFQIVFGTR